MNSNLINAFSNGVYELFYTAIDSVTTSQTKEILAWVSPPWIKFYYLSQEVL